MEGISDMKDFFVDTKGHCFICLNKIEKCDKPFSLQWLSRCLNLNGKKLLPLAEEKVSLATLKKAEGSKVTLCEECLFISDQFYEVLQQMEQIELQVLFLTNLIGGRMERAERDGNISLKPSDLETFQFAQKVRKMIIEKCSLKLKKSHPRIRLKRLPCSKIPVPNTKTQRKTFLRPMPKSKREEIQGKTKNVRKSEAIKVHETPVPKPQHLRNPPLKFQDQDMPKISPSSKKASPLPPKLLPERPSTRSTPSRLVPTCAVCKMTFESLPSLQAHCLTAHKLRKSAEAAQNKMGKFKCNLCTAAFKRMIELQSHRNEVHLGKTFKCIAPCNKVMSTATTLRKHKTRCAIYKMVMEKITKTGNEDKKEQSKTSVKKVLKRRHSAINPKFKCNVCKRSFISFSAFQGHTKNFHRIDKVKVPSLPKPVPLKKHKFRCNQCPESFKKRFQLIRHRDSVHLGRTYRCVSPCSKVYPVAGSLWKHKKSCPIHQKSQMQEAEKEEEADNSSVPHILSVYTGGAVKSEPSEGAPELEYYPQWMSLDSNDHDVIVNGDGVGVDVKWQENDTSVAHNSPPKLQMEVPNRNPNTCQVCDKVFTCAKSARRHFLVLHLNHKPYQCTICKKSFGARGNLNKHLKASHSIKLVKLKSNQGHSGKHEVPNTPASKASKQCPVCNKEFLTINAAERHFRAVHLKEKPFKCGTCGRAFAFKENWERHYKTVHAKIEATPKPKSTLNGKVHTQDVSKKITSVLKTFANAKKGKAAHLRPNGKDKLRNLVCTICAKKFNRYQNLQRHLTEVHSSMTFKCEICPKAFSRNDNLLAHKKKAHPLVFNRKATTIQKIKARKLQQNKSTIKGGRKLACDICSSKFSTFGALTRHIQNLHNGGREKKFLCDFLGCDKKYRYAYELKRHQKVHVNMTFTCVSDCALVFGKEMDLKEHQKTCGVYQSSES